MTTWGTGTWAAATPQLLARVDAWSADDPRLAALEQQGLVVSLARCTGVHVVDAPPGALDHVRTTDGDHTVWIARDALLPSNRAADCGCRTDR